MRVIDSEGEIIGIMPIRDAIRRAEGDDLDLVEISPNTEPPVCRIMDFGKFIYEQSKKKAAAKKKQKQIQVKEIKFRPATEEGDYQIKLRAIIRFLEDGNKVKVTIRFRGRELSHQELGMDILERIIEDIEEYGVLEQRAKREGRQLIMIIGQKRK